MEDKVEAKSLFFIDDQELEAVDCNSVHHCGYSTTDTESDLAATQQDSILVSLGNKTTQKRIESSSTQSDHEKHPHDNTAFTSLPPPSKEDNRQNRTTTTTTITTNRCREDTSFGDDKEFDYLKVPKLPRSSSMKSLKTPPGTPTRRKSVRFADALGLDLALVCHILNPDEPPTVLPSLTQQDPDDASGDEKIVRVSSHWRLCFLQPGTDVCRRVAERKVLLESCVVSNSNRKVYGTVRVANLAYAKDVRVRYTTNGWLTSQDVVAAYVEHSNDLVTDRFSFVLTIPDHLGARSRVEFAVVYSVGEDTYWDNNGARNYALECVEMYNNCIMNYASMA